MSSCFARAIARGNCRDCDVVVNVVFGPNCCQTAQVLRLFSGATNNVPGVLPGGALDPQFCTGLPLFAATNPYVQASIARAGCPIPPVPGGSAPTRTTDSANGGVFYYTNRFLLCSTNQAQGHGPLDRG